LHATLRSIKAKPGQAAAVADLIRSEYLPMLDDIAGFVSYTLVDGGDDTVSSIGLFTEVGAADEANAKARAWTAEKLSPFVESPLSAAAGVVVISYPA
jgi:hypothetical protein